ncbi:MAG: CHAD domain-containing protein [Sphingomonadaceae bacterium]
MGGVEIELKAGISPGDASRLARRLARVARLGPPRRLVTTYFDTKDGCLAEAGIALRVRRQSRRSLLSVKAGRAAVGGYQHASEVECPMRGRHPDLAVLPDRPLAGEIERRLQGKPLRPRFLTDISRRTAAIAGQGGEVEVALDRGRIVAGERDEPVCEVEFELRGGSPEAVFACAESLLADLPARLDLPSKASRGEALARGRPLAGGPLAARPVPPAPEATAGQVFEARLALLAPALAANLHATLAQDAPEGPHQLRVALRRLRVSLRLFRPILEPRAARRMAEEARDIGRLVSPLRDADVLVGDLILPRVDDAPLAEALRQWWNETRHTTRRQLLQAQATGFAIRLLGWSALGGWQRPDSRERQILNFAEVLAPGLDRLWKAVRHRGARLAELDPEERHEFRKDLKKLRYGTEFASEAHQAKAFLSALKRLQEDLGALNDLAVLEAFAPPLPDPRHRQALEAVRADLLTGARARSDALLGRACRHWRALAATDPWWVSAPRGQAARNR